MDQMKLKKKHEEFKGNRTGKKGHTLTELILVVAMLGLFGIATFTLVVSSSNAYKNIMEKTDVDSELRIAISYLDTKLKQNDSAKSIRLEANPSGAGNAIVIENTYEDEVYETWIYQSGGRLKEMIVAKGEPFQDELSFEISAVDGFIAVYDETDKLLKVNVWSSTQGGRRELDTYIAMKTGINVGAGTKS